MYKKTTLKNGLRIITIPQKETQAVTILVLVATGSKYEKKEINGISHFLEHMYFKGTKKRSSVLAVFEHLDKIGGIFNAFTGEDYTGYFAKVSANHFEKALDWISDIFLNSLLPEKELEKEKGVIIEEINMHHDIPMNHVQLLWNRLLYGDQPAGWDIAGTKETVAKVNRRKLLDYMENQYVASNTIVCLAGKIKELSAIKKAKKYFSKISVKKPFKKAEVVERQTAPECLLQYQKTDQTHLCVGARSYNIFHPQRFSQSLLALILGGMMSSRLFIEIREKLGVAYYVKTEAESNPDTGFLVTQAGVDNKRAGGAIQVILKEYKKISRKKVYPGELKKAKDYLKGKMSLSLESSDAQASFYGLQELLEKKILTPEEVFAELDKVSANDILKTAKDIFRSRKLNLALIGPFKDKSKFQKLLKF